MNLFGRNQNRIIVEEPGWIGDVSSSSPVRARIDVDVTDAQAAGLIGSRSVKCGAVIQMIYDHSRSCAIGSKAYGGVLRVTGNSNRQ